MKIDHIGYAVKKIDKARKAFEKLGYQFGEIMEDHDRNVFISFGMMEGSTRIELVAPIISRGDSPVDSYLNKIGPTPYHICYLAENFEDDLKRLQNEGFRMTIPPASAIAFGGRRVAFLMNLGMGLIEIVEPRG